MFEIGDKVWDFVYGWGEVVVIDTESETPVMADFMAGAVTSFYTQDGKICKWENRRLFFEEMPIPATALKRPRWRAEEGNFYYSVSTYGTVINFREMRYESDDVLFKVGNYFQSVEKAKESKFYKIFQNDEDILPKEIRTINDFNGLENGSGLKVFVCGNSKTFSVGIPWQDNVIDRIDIKKVGKKHFELMKAMGFKFVLLGDMIK